MELLSLLNPFELIKNFLNWAKRPYPTIDFEYNISLPENDYCHYRVDINTSRKCLFFRLGVNNHGKKIIEEADVRVEKIESIDREGNRRRISSAPFFLHWANENTDNSRTIYPYTPVFIDLLYTDEGRNDLAFLFFKGKHGNSGIKEFLTPGKWVITVKLLGRNIQPLQKEIVVDFNGKWNEIKLHILGIKDDKEKILDKDKNSSNAINSRPKDIDWTKWGTILTGLAVIVTLLTWLLPAVSFLKFNEEKKISTSSVATSTMSFSEILSKALSYDTVAERQDFLNKYRGIIVSGESIVTEVSRTSSDFLIDFIINRQLITCWMSGGEDNERKFILMKGKKIRFTGIFSFTNIYGHGLSLDNCDLEQI